MPLIRRLCKIEDTFGHYGYLQISGQFLFPLWPNGPQNGQELMPK